MIIPFLILCLTISVSAAELPTLREHQPLIAELAVTNPYDRALKVVHINSSCTCSRLELAEDFLLPGGRTTLHLAVDNQRHGGERQQIFWLEASDPDLPAIKLTHAWRVVPNVTVDLMPAAGPFDGRPANPNWHNVYALLSHQRPDETSRLRKVLRLASPDPDLAITSIDYPGSFWTLSTLERDDGAILLVAQGPADGSFAATTLEETVTVHTNHPHKPSIELVFRTALDAQAGRPGAVDPWIEYR
ncbi:MAG: hypothetical protein ACYTF0_01910 [Planctomycetota bacterium]